ncbi:MAG TPA: AI-2E family transporter [Actinomycetota bacterium]|jgi:predicted PurR-regulated permease PerM
MSQPPGVRPRDVWTVIWVTLAVAAGLWLLYEVKRILVWILLAAFLAAVVGPLVDRLARRVSRGLAVALVVVGIFAAVGGVTYAFGRPLVEQSARFVENLPKTVDQVRQAPVVRRVVERFNIEDRVAKVAPDLPKRLIGLSGPVLAAFRTLGQLVVALITIFVLTIFFLLYGPTFLRSGLDLVSDLRRREQLRTIGRKVGRVFSGWLAGNLLTSGVAGLGSLIAFLVVGLPYSLLLALWVGVADLLPLVGATLGALPAVIVAFIHSTTAGIVVTAFFILYQQFENHVIQPAVYGRTIRINPFVVLVAVLIGVELAGFLGALLALPAAGAIQVIVEEVIDERRRRRVHQPHEVEAERLALGSNPGANGGQAPSERSLILPGE